MSDIFENGGPAFPFLTDTHIHPGISMRDYFAAMALQGFLACPHQFMSDKGPVERNPVLLASIAYCQADAMLKERSK